MRIGCWGFYSASPLTALVCTEGANWIIGCPATRRVWAGIDCGPGLLLSDAIGIHHSRGCPIEVQIQTRGADPTIWGLMPDYTWWWPPARIPPKTQCRSIEEEFCPATTTLSGKCKGQLSTLAMSDYCPVIERVAPNKNGALFPGFAVVSRAKMVPFHTLTWDKC